MLDGWFRLASTLGKSLKECLEEISWAEYRLWNLWFAQEMNRPSRSDFYTMRLTHQVALVNRNKSFKFESEKYRLKFESQLKRTKPGFNDSVLDVEQATIKSKSRWAAALRALSVPVRKVR